MSSFLHPTFLLSILIALAVHECAHAYAAYKLGDGTARSLGRLTLNPIAHIDLIGALMFLFVGFGWGKPVPVDPRNFRHPVRDSAIVAFAGPLSNFILAFIAFIGLAIFGVALAGESVWALPSLGRGANVLHAFLIQFFGSLLFVNLGLMAFNLLPVPPLDGSGILRAFIPYRYQDEYERYLQFGPMLLLGLLVADQFLGIGIISGFIGFVMDVVLRIFELVLPGV